MKNEIKVMASYICEKLNVDKSKIKYFEKNKSLEFEHLDVVLGSFSYKTTKDNIEFLIQLSLVNKLKVYDDIKEQGIEIFLFGFDSREKYFESPVIILNEGNIPANKITLDRYVKAVERILVTDVGKREVVSKWLKFKKEHPLSESEKKLNAAMEKRKSEKSNEFNPELFMNELDLITKSFTKKQKSEFISKEIGKLNKEEKSKLVDSLNVSTKERNKSYIGSKNKQHAMEILPEITKFLKENQKKIYRIIAAGKTENLNIFYGNFINEYNYLLNKVLELTNSDFELISTQDELINIRNLYESFKRTVENFNL